MNLRTFRIRLAGGTVKLRVETGYGTAPAAVEYDLEPAAALALSGQLEAAVHTAATRGLPLFATAETQPTDLNPS